MDEIDQMNTPIEKNYYPIHEACKTNNIVAVKHLLPHVNLNICSPIGTPLMIACKYNYSDLIDLLIYHHVDLSVKDEHGNIFLHYLVTHPDTEDRFYLFGDYMIEKNNEGLRPLDVLDKDKITFDIVRSLPHVYFFGGHGCDTGEEKIVPENCLYVTFALCGNSIKYREMTTFYSIDPDLLLDPINNKRAIEKHLRLPIQIYKPGDTYSNILYSTPLCFKNTDNKNYGCLPSGLQNVYLKKENFVLPSKNIKQTLFEYSIFPRIQNVPDISSEEEIDEKWSIHISQSQLFRFKGIFYNVSCRGPCNGNEENVALRRKKSMTRRIEEGNIKTLDQLREADIDTLQEWIDDPGILFHAPREVVLELIPDKQALLKPSKFIGGKRKTKKTRKTRKR